MFPNILGGYSTHPPKKQDYLVRQRVKPGGIVWNTYARKDSTEYLRGTAEAEDVIMYLMPTEGPALRMDGRGHGIMTST